MYDGCEIRHLSDVKYITLGIELLLREALYNYLRLLQVTRAGRRAVSVFEDFFQCIFDIEPPFPKLIIFVVVISTYPADIV